MLLQTTANWKREDEMSYGRMISVCQRQSKGKITPVFRHKARNSYGVLRYKYTLCKSHN